MEDPVEVPSRPLTEEASPNVVQSCLPKNRGQNCWIQEIPNPWEAQIKVTNPTENLLEVLYLPEVKNCPQTPMGEREEEMEAVQKLLVLPDT